MTINGSFQGTRSRTTGSKSFSAMELGHVSALNEAIQYLSSLVPAATELDHRLQAEGAEPNAGFGLPRMS